MLNKRALFILVCQLVPLHASSPWKSWLKFTRQTFLERKNNTNHHSNIRDEDLLIANQSSRSPSGLKSKQLNSKQSMGRTALFVTLVAKNAVQWGLIIFLVRNIWQAVKDVLGEISSMDDPESDSQLLKALPKADANKENSLIHRVAWKLSECGIPLQSSNERSVESLLRSLTKGEASLLDQCLYIPSSCPKISGFHDIQEELQAMLNRFLQRDSSSTPHPYASLFDDDKSHHVLLYGPPGMGKSLLMKQIACQIPTVLLTPSVLLRKYVGETNTRVRTLFTALQKIAPVLLCLDEVDGLFRERQSQEHEVNRDLKTEFLQWWDGLLSGQKIWIVAATNRPFEVDSAVLRRLPRQYYIGHPDVGARQEMLQNLLDGLPHDVDLNHTAQITHGFTASDLRRLLQTAATDCRNHDVLSTGHVMRALESIKPTPQTPAYIAALKQFVSPNEQQQQHHHRQPYFHHYQIVVDPSCWDRPFNLDQQESSEDLTDFDTDDF